MTQQELPQGLGGAEVPPVPPEELRARDPAPAVERHLLVHEAPRGQLELDVERRRPVDPDGWAAAGPAVQREVDARIDRHDGEPQARIPGRQDRPRREGSGRVAAEEAVLDLLQGEDAGPDPVGGPPEEVPRAVDRPADGEGEDPVEHQGVVDVDPEREPERPRREGPRIDPRQVTGGGARGRGLGDAASLAWSTAPAASIAAPTARRHPSSSASATSGPSGGPSAPGWLRTRRLQKAMTSRLYHAATNRVRCGK